MYLCVRVSVCEGVIVSVCDIEISGHWDRTAFLGQQNLGTGYIKFFLEMGCTQCVNYALI